MPDSISKTQRWLDLIAFLIGHRYPVSVDQIMKAVPSYTADYESGDSTRQQSVRRKFERDKDELRELGIPIETVEYSINYGTEEQTGYRLARGDYYLPYLRIVGEERTGGRPRQAGAGTVDLEPGEMSTALSALRRVSALPSFPYASEARSAFRKLSGDLDLSALDSRVMYASDSGAEEIRDRLRELCRALHKRKTVRFRYHGIHRGEATDREVHPYGLFFQGGSWYLSGHDLGREGDRVFRVSRMEPPTINHLSPNTPDFEVPDEFDLASHTGRAPWELGSDDDEPVAARVRFTFPRSLWAERNGHGRLLESRDDGSAVREFDVTQVNPFLRWVLTFEGDAQILSPPALREELVALAAKVVQIHERSAENERPSE